MARESLSATPANSLRQPPSWVPEGLLAAVADRAEGLVSAPSDSDGFSDVPCVSPALSSDRALELFGFPSDPGVRTRHFSGKRIADIGGGFSGMAGLLSSYGAEKVTVADPVFSAADFEIAYERNFERISRFVDASKYALSTSDSLNSRARAALRERLPKFEKVLSEIAFWKNHSPGKHPAIERLGLFAEDLRGIPDASRDFVFVVNVMAKDGVDVLKAAGEIVRILAPGGTAYSLDYADGESEKRSREFESAVPSTFCSSRFADEFRIVEIRKP